VTREPRQALDVLMDGVAHNPRSALLWTHVGLVQTALDQEREALAAYRKAVALDGAQHVAANNGAYLLVTAHEESLRDREEALRLATRALAAQPENINYLDTMAEVAFARGDVAGARRNIARALEVRPDDAHLREQARRFAAAPTTRRRAPVAR
jgi:tetratricopeptide (TPR) repeat protein